MSKEQTQKDQAKQDQRAAVHDQKVQNQGQPHLDDRMQHQNRGQQKQVEIRNPTGASLMITQEDWREKGKQYKSEGWNRVDGTDADETTA